MANLASEDIKRRVREASDIAAVIQGYGILLKRMGRSLVACCPFHQEKSPSFNVNAEGQYFKCFGCGKGGDVFTFVELQERVEFREALKILADRAGITLEFDPQAQERHKKEVDWKSYLYKVNASAAAYFREMLYADAGKAARTYLEKRGLTEESWERFGLGYAPQGNGLVARLLSQKAPMKALEKAGVVGLRDDGSAYDYFRDRVMFPIADSQGRVIAFGGRVLDGGEPKYLNTRETPLFVKGRTIYGLPQAREAMNERKVAYVVEGYTDVIMCHQFGVQNVVACLGTAITADHVRALRRLCDEARVLTDSDAAGARAAERSVEVLFQEDMPAQIVRLPGAAKDPCDFLLAQGKEAFEAALAQGVSLFEYKFQRVAAQYDLATPSGQAAAAKDLMALVSLSPDGLRKAAYRREVAGRLNLPERDLAYTAVRAPLAERVAEAPGPKVVAVPAPVSPLAAAERELLRWTFHEPAWLETVVGEVDLTSLNGPVEALIGRALLAGLDGGQLPPDLNLLAAEGRTPAGTVVRQVLERLGDREPEGEAEALLFAQAQNLAIALADEPSEFRRLKPEEAFAMLVKRQQGCRLERDLADAKRVLSAERARGAGEKTEAAERLVMELQTALTRFRKRLGGEQA